MRNIEKKYPASMQDGGLNADSADFAVGINQVVNATNVRWGSTDAGVTDVVEEIGGTRQISESLPSITFMTVGSAEDIENNRLLFFKYCTTGPWHRITCYDKDADTEYIVLLSSQVTGGFNFNKDYLIHSTAVVNGLLIWTQEGDTQHKINIDAGIKLNQPSYDTDQEPYTVPIEKGVISLIKRPPNYPATAVKVTQPSIANNFIGDNVFWFAYRYFYRDKETSVVSVHSTAVLYNILADTYNCVDVTMSLLEHIDQDVQRVELGVRTDNNSQFFGIKVWDKNNATQAAEIAAHNVGTTALYYRFYNNQVGAPWGDAYSVKPFESCPIESKTLALVRNRVHLANDVLGYDAPDTTSLAATLVDEEDGASVTGQWYEVVVDNSGFLETYYVIYIGGIGTANGYYSLLPYPGHVSLPLPSSIDFNDYELAAAVSSTLAGYFGVRPQDLVSLTLTGDSATVTNAPTNVTLIGAEAFKSNASYQLGIVFYDLYDRKCGVVTNDDLIYTTADRDFDTVAYTTGIQWTLSNANAINEIPDWAVTYAVVITKCLRTRFFLQARAAQMAYAVLDPLTGEYTFTTALYANTLNGVGVNISALKSFNAGYLFEEGNGDICKIYIDSVATVYYLKIVAQQGEWIVCNLQDLGTLTGAPSFADGFFEIYTPYRQSANEPYYEVGEKYAINNAGTVNRGYSIFTDTIGGDVILLQRATGGTQYLSENMSGNDNFYGNWFTDSGRINIVTNEGQSIERNAIAYSNTYILGSNVNGLCEFEALNIDYVPYECGQIQKLQVTSKVQNEQGSIMLAVCQAQTASIYIGEVQLLGSSGNAFVAQSAGVIGTINVLKGNYGTINPESVTEYRGNVFWVDASTGRVIQYSSNGLFPISQYGMSRFWRLFCKQYVGMTAAAIEALGSRPFIFTTVDPYHNELLITIPQVLAAPPAGYLPDYPLINNPFDIYDGEAKTMVYKIGVGEGNPYWMGSTQYTPEWLATLQNELYSSKNGILWQHNQVNYCNFYGTQYKPSLAVISNSIPSAVKVFNALSVESNKTPIWAYFYALSPNQQATDIMEYEWQNLEGMLYAAIKRDKITPTAEGYTTTALLTGAPMRTYALKIYFEFSGGTVPLQLRFININFDISRGHSTFQR